MTSVELQQIKTFATIVKTGAGDGPLSGLAEEVATAAEIGLMYPKGEERRQRINNAQVLLDTFIDEYTDAKTKGIVSGAATQQIDDAVDEIFMTLGSIASEI